jgi:undecaprenyl phosphate-alpha-L-ara4N flippase subunit ArnE
VTGQVILLLAISIACDVFGQLAFKVGAGHLPSTDSVGLQAFLVRLLGQPWILAGVGIYAVEFVVWIRVLALVPLGIAFPIASLNILGIVLVSRVLLGEPVSRRQWAGAALITAGVAIVAQMS